MALREAKKTTTRHIHNLTQQKHYNQ